MKEDESVLCSRCGSGLEFFEEGSISGQRCLCCGLSVVTTNLSGIKTDSNIYEVSCSGDYRNEAHVRAVSAVSGFNFIAARKRLKEGHFSVFSGEAVDVLKVKNTLVSAGVYCTVEPDFPWG
ncbi:hypothetical protein [Pseudomonas sp. PA27(2017)]|uniref:hypothetical protein n=1 Tax=Pseudomonas sp. PA27(2017) TaxID=1932112 RepID=UPI0011154347|nr:hypothetical protein [Pseudomonas sp. PA27(2017)]